MMIGFFSRGRRMNSTLEAAIQEAMNELDKKMEQVSLQYQCVRT